MTARAYGGRSQAERVHERRGKLIAALFDLLIDRDVGSLSIRGICEHAGLTRRYFYESFADLDQLLVAAFDTINHDVIVSSQHTLDAAGDDPVRTAESLLRHTITVATSHRGKARLIVAAGSNQMLTAKRHDTVRALAGLIDSFIDHDDDTMLVAIILVGGITELVALWLRGDVNTTVDEIVTQTGQIVRRLLAPGPQ